MVSIFDQGAPAPCPQPFNLAAHVLAHADRQPDKIALAILGETGAQRWSYARLQAVVRGTATGLLKAGLSPGDKVLMRLGNEVDFPILYLGAITAGLVPVPTSAQLTEREVTAMLDHLRPAAIVAADDVPCPQTKIPVISRGTLRSWRDLPPAAYAMGDPDRLAYVVYTSGTSGVPRAVGHAHRAIWARQMMIEGWYGLTPADRVLHAGAFNWTFTLGTGLLDPWAMGATALIPQAGLAPRQLGLLLKRYDASLFAAAPGVYRQMLKHALPALPKLRHGLAAGEKLSDTIRDGWAAATGRQIYEAFGMSECSTFVSAPPGRDMRGACLGWPQPGRRVAILGADHQPVPFGAEGELAVSRRDPGMMLGYIGADAALAARQAGEWFLTGDRAEMSSDGAIRYLGRGDDMMNPGGYRVSPIEVEAALSTLPGISEIAVTEVEVKPGVTVIAAFYTGPDPLDATELTAQASLRLARYKCPRLWVHLAALPRNANGKVLRSDLRKTHAPAAR